MSKIPPLTVVLRILAILMVTLLGLPFAMLLYWRKKRRWLDVLVRNYFRLIARIVRLRIEVSGNLANVRPLLLVCNHSSYLDIIILGASAPVTYCPKSEIAGWPIIGQLCKINGCVFIDRKISKTADNKNALADALTSGRAITLFPEGTTSNGKHVLPFRSSYFSVVEDGIEEAGVRREVIVQPVSIAYTKLNNLPIGISDMPRIAWFGDMDLLPHLVDFLKLGYVQAHITFHTPKTGLLGQPRKEIAHNLQAFIADAII